MPIDSPEPRPAVVVTGGAGGLGAWVAEELLRRGYPLILVDRDADALTAASERHQGGAGRVRTCEADLASLDGVRVAAASILRHAPVGGLVNNAGGQRPGAQYPDAAPDSWLAALTVNLLAPMLLTQLLWEELARNGGSVVNVGSSGGLGTATYGSPEYGAAKAGLHRYTASLGGRSDVTVCGIIPGWIGLDRARREREAMPPEEREAAGALIEPRAIAEEVAALLERGRPGELRRLL